VRADLRVLSDAERAEVHERTLRVLVSVGMRVDTELGRRLLAAAGAEVDDESRRVRFPPVLVEESLRRAPKDFALGARRPEWRATMNSGEATLVMSGEATHVVDGESGALRPGTHDDWLQATRLIDAIDEIGVYWATVEGTPPGTPPLAGWVDYNVELQGAFSKHVQDSWLEPAWSPWVLEVLDVVFGRDEVRRRHPYSFLLTPVSPLVIDRPCTESWLALRGWDIPVAVLPMPMMGTTSPASLIATTLLANCETLGTLCLVQAAEPGTPFIAAALPVAMHPRSGRYASNTFHPMLSAACTEMARFYGLPVMGSGSGTDALGGAQAAYEKALGSLVGSLARPDLLVGPGSLGGALVFDPRQVLIDVEMFRMSRHASRGVAVDDGLWLDDVLGRVGPGGSFLGERSTRTATRDGEWYLPQLGWHDGIEAWQAAGRPTLEDECRERVAALLAAHEPLPLPDDVTHELEALRRRALEEDGM
jgi:trimethylamine--corrinoid protein Co-methyltransferase